MKRLPRSAAILSTIESPAAQPSAPARSNTDTNAVDPSKVPELVDSIDPGTVGNLFITGAKI